MITEAFFVVNFWHKTVFDRTKYVFFDCLTYKIIEKYTPRKVHLLGTVTKLHNPYETRGFCLHEILKMGSAPLMRE